MTHKIEKRNPRSHRFSLWVVVTMAFVAPLCWWSLRQIRLENEIQQWVPDGDSERQATRWVHDRFQFEDRILLAWDGSSINDPRFDKLVEQLAGKVDSQGLHRGGLPYVRSVVDPRPLLDAMQKNEIEPQESVRRLEGTLLGTGPMKVRLTEYSRSALKKSKRELQASFKIKFGQNLEILEAVPDLTSLVSIPSPNKEGATPGDPSPPAVMSFDGTFSDKVRLDHDLQVSWKGMHPGSESTIAVARWMTTFVPERNGGQPIVEKCFFVPGSPAALEIELSDAGLADQGEAVAAIRSVCQRVGISAESLRMSGQALAETELNEGTLKAVWDTSFPLYQLNHRSVILTSILASFVLALGLIRRIRLATIIMVVSLFVICTTVAVIPLARSSVNQFLIVLPTLLVGITISGALQICSNWKQTASDKEATGSAELTSESRIFRILACVAMTLCLITLCTAKLSPIWDLGIYAAVGSIIASLMIVYGLPALIQVLNIRPLGEASSDEVAWKFFGRILTKRPGWNTVAVLAVFLGFGYFGKTMLTIQTKPYREWTDAAKIALDYRNLETYVAGTMSVDTVVRFDQLALKDTNFLDRMEIVRNVEEKLRLQPAVSGCTSIADFQPVTDHPADNAGFSQRTKYNRRSANVQQMMTEGELPIARSHYVSAEQVPSSSTKSGPAGFSQPGDELWRISARVIAVSNGELANVLSGMHRTVKGELKLQPGSNYLIAGELPQYVKRVDSLTTSLIGSFSLSCVLILGLMAFARKNISVGLVMMVPCIAPIALFFGTLSWAGWPIDIELLMTAPIALGMMVDGKLRYLNRIQKAMQSGLSRLEAVVESLVFCGPGMCQTAAVYVIGFFVLTQAELPFISRFGLMMSALVGVSLLTDLMLLPQLVAGPLGRIFENSKTAVVEAAQVLNPEIPVSVQAAPITPEADAIPSPHIKPLVPPAKKRRSTTRREPDPE